MGITDADAKLVEAVKAHALEHYEDGGWDVVVECFSAAEIVEVFDIGRRYGDVIETAEQAIAAFASPVEVWADRQADARNSAF